MNSDLDKQINAGFNSIVSHAPEIGPTPSHHGALPPRPRGQGRSIFTIGLSAFVLLAVAMSAFALLTYGTWRSDTDTLTAADGADTEPLAPEATFSAGATILLEPGADSEVSTLNRTMTEFPDGSVGAIVAPNGTVFGLSLGPGFSFDSLPERFEVAEIRGHRAWAYVDGSAPEQVRRGIEASCATFYVTSGGEEKWSPAIEELAQSMVVEDDSLTIDLAPGWQSLGVSTEPTRYRTDMTISLEGADREIWMSQMPGQPIGAHLSSMETNPVQIQTGSASLWYIAGATTPGYNTVVGSRAGTAFTIGGEISLDVLLDLVESLTLVEANEWLSGSTEKAGSEATTETTIADNLAGSCARTELRILEDS